MLGETQKAVLKNMDDLEWYTGFDFDNPSILGLSFDSIDHALRELCRNGFVDRKMEDQYHFIDESGMNRIRNKHYVYRLSIKGIEKLETLS